MLQGYICTYESMVFTFVTAIINCNMETTRDDSVNFVRTKYSEPQNTQNDQRLRDGRNEF